MKINAWRGGGEKQWQWASAKMAAASTWRKSYRRMKTAYRKRKSGQAEGGESGEKKNGVAAVKMKLIKRRKRNGVTKASNHG
jgi:hypothetical protein